MDAPRSRRRLSPFLLGLIAILLALPVGYFVFLGSPPPAVSAPPPPVSPPDAVAHEAPSAEHPQTPPAPKLAELRLQDLRGTVQLRHGGGEWQDANKGDLLRASDSVRTLDGAYAVLIGGEAVEIRMEAGTEVSVAELTDSLSRLLLGNGMTTVRVKTGTQHTVEMGATGSDAVARSTGGLFTVTNNGAGTVALASLEGETSLTGQRKVVIVRAGQQSIVRPGQGPSDPTSIPSSLLLKVNWPARPRRQALVAGQTEPGTHVLIDGKSVLPDAEGRFSVPVSLKEGKNRVRVSARSVGGLQSEDQAELSVDTTPPKGVTVDPGLWK
jgi:hypothetical protein